MSKEQKTAEEWYSKEQMRQMFADGRYAERQSKDFRPEVRESKIDEYFNIKLSAVAKEVEQGNFLSVLEENIKAKITAKEANMSVMEIFETDNIYDAIIMEYTDLIAIYRDNFSQPAGNGWVSVEDKTPVAYKTGNWNGKQSDLVLTLNVKNETYHLARLYEGYLDGNHFKDWYHVDDFEIPTPTHWQYLPPNP